MKKLVLAAALVAFSAAVSADFNGYQDPGLGINGKLNLSGFVGQGAISNTGVSGGIVGSGDVIGSVSSWAYDKSGALSLGCGDCFSLDKTWSISKGGASVDLLPLNKASAIEGVALYSASGSAVSGYALTGNLAVYGEYGVIDASNLGVNGGSVSGGNDHDGDDDDDEGDDD